MKKSKHFTGKFTEYILCEHLLPNEPAGIVRTLTHTLNSSNAKMFDTNCTVILSINDDLKEYCDYVYAHNYMEKENCQLDFSYLHFIDLKSPIGNNIYFVILHISKNVSKTTGKIYLLISMCYINNPNTNIRLLQYTYSRYILEVSKSLF